MDTLAGNSVMTGVRPSACFYYWRPAFLGLLLWVFFSAAYAQTPEQVASDSLKTLSLEELMNVEVTSVSKRPQKLTEVASAIQVITSEDIQRSGATRLPEVLRLLPNLQVARVNAHDWAVTSRGFNGSLTNSGTLANKLLVMVDGRTVYTPLFGGVFWNVQNVLLEDVDRIEAVSGPGGTLWGVNAVNGVINIISKSSKETQGLYVTGAGGTFLQNHFGIRYGGKITPKLFYRVYAQYFNQANTRIDDTTKSNDSWEMYQTGFRMDYIPSAQNKITVQGDFYANVEGYQPSTARCNGQNLLARWKHHFSEKSSISVRAYFDRTFRDFISSGFKDELTTYDLEFQHRFAIAKRQSILWGLGYRLMMDNEESNSGISPEDFNMPLYSGFIQDEIEIVPEKIKFTVGAKLQHNVYTSFELQPSARLAWTPAKGHTIWAAVSKAVRMPSRIDEDYNTPVFSTPGKNFKSEKVYAYELGYRVRPMESLSLSFAAFYNQYKDLRSIDYNPNPPSVYIFANNHQAESWGFEFSVNYQMMQWWRIRGGYTLLKKNIWSTDPAVHPNSSDLEAVDPVNQLMFQSMMNLPYHFQLDIIGRYVDSLPQVVVPPSYSPSYFTFDAKLTWLVKEWGEFSLIGANLYQKAHTEFGKARIPRNVYIRATCRF